MEIKVLSTGSKGNCYALGAGDEILLLDAGMTVMEIMRGIAPEFRRVIGTLITHEHQDHAKAVQELARFGVDVYATAGTLDAVMHNSWKKNRRMHAVRQGEIFDVGGFRVMAFRTEHDANDPCGFLIMQKFTKEVLLYATDTYYLRNTFPNVNYWLVECNHSRQILDAQSESGELNAALRKRLITSHMSLERLLDALAANDLTKTRKIVLIHMSDSRSDEAEMVKAVNAATGVETVAADDGMIIDLEMEPF